MNFWYFLIKYSQIIVFTICPDPFKSARLHIWKCLCDSRHCIHFSKLDTAAALKSFAWASELFHEMQKNCSVTCICKDFSRYRPIQDLYKSEVYLHYSNTHWLQLVYLQPQSGWSLLAPFNTLSFKTISTILFSERLSGGGSHGGGCCEAISWARMQAKAIESVLKQACSLV